MGRTSDTSLLSVTFSNTLRVGFIDRFSQQTLKKHKPSGPTVSNSWCMDSIVWRQKAMQTARWASLRLGPTEIVLASLGTTIKRPGRHLVYRLWRKEKRPLATCASPGLGVKLSLARRISV
ncbi:uncharacterized protein PGTG_12356 [Puccinia graminis f. sp. tritici CRL 75-36-700-3]|uniref:Uncharacterized protein n=1 Tax=Puccinia graminis f. sp. tritici (strain CRL 75-36-700-3 / race SCCL) TaxID=418459 RepID=E3KQ25_PUCGT|nr:uncharacterized protein PGTG_12356 [Puccinia graminis f. sp. tritici CRL 75-36-700-3]EFP86400.1 hypothetical protein PGTG_12356 [Puccinia graminis f. sp. tritici CRL 75-36-700-3]